MKLTDLYTKILEDVDVPYSESLPKDSRLLPYGKKSPFMFLSGYSRITKGAKTILDVGSKEQIFEVCDLLNMKKDEIYFTNVIKSALKPKVDPSLLDAKAHMRRYFYNELILTKPQIIFVLDKFSKDSLEKVFPFELTNKPQRLTFQIKVDDERTPYTCEIVYVENMDTKSALESVDKIRLDWKFIHLHTHNSLSLKDGVGTPETRIKWAVKNNKPAVATSNHGNICDWIIIYNNCKEHGMKPVLGCEFYFNRKAEELKTYLTGDDPENIRKRKELRKSNNHFTAFAKNLEGYYNMIKIHNDAWVNNFYRNPITSPVTIEANHEGIICLSGCSGSEANRVITQKYYLHSEKRIEDVNMMIDNKLSSMKSLFRSKQEEKFYEDEYLDDFDFQYYRDHQDDKLEEEDYKKAARAFVAESDQEQIENADKRSREIIDWWHGIFKDDFYIELMVIDYAPQRYIDQELIKIAKEKNIPVVITNDSHYLEKKDAQIQALQMLNEQDKTFEDLKNDKEGKIWTMKSEEMYFKSVSEMHDAWEKWYKSDIFTEEVFWEGIKNAVNIIDKVENYEVDKSNKLPKIYDNPESILAKKIVAGLKAYGMYDDQELKNRALFEYDIICKKGFADYFLILEDLIGWAKKTYGKYSVGPGRGSAAGSLVNYIIGITDVNPMKHGLMFERFLDIDRTDAVDIDTDFSLEIRDDVIQYLITKYGREYVANICTFGIAKTKVAVQDVARVFGIPPAETLNITTKLDDIDEDGTLEEIEVAYPALKEYFDKWEGNGFNLRYYVEGIRGSHRNISVHASGVLVSSDKLSDNIPLCRSSKTLVTGWQEGADYHELSDIGYYKFDILGLSNLKVMEDARQLIKKRHGREIIWEDLDLDEKEVYDNIVHKGDHFGIFQFESPFVQRIINEIKPTTFEELAAISALLRPGPLKMGMDKDMKRHKHGIPDETGHVWTVEDIPECIRDILAPTLGILCISGSSLILTDSGLISMEEIVNKKLNINVMTVNEENKELEWKPITNWYNNGEEEVIELTFENGKTLKCTSDHKINTLNRGWVEAGKLTENDEIICE